MRTKRWMAFLLAFIMLFSEMAPAVAADVSGNDEGAYASFDENVQDVSEDEPDFGEDELNNTDFGTDEKTFVLKEGSYRNVYYYGYNAGIRKNKKKNSYNPFVIYEDAIAIVDGEEYKYYGDEDPDEINIGHYKIVNAVDEDHNAVEVDSYGFLPLGEYYMPITFSLNSETYTCYAPFEVKAVESVPVIEVDKDYTYTEFEHGRNILVSFYGKADHTYLPNVSSNAERESGYSFDPFTLTFDESSVSGYVRRVFEHEDRIPCNEDQRVYLVVDYYGEFKEEEHTVTLNIAETPSVETIEIEQRPYQTQLYYGIDGLNTSGLSFMVHYVDGSEENSEQWNYDVDSFIADISTGNEADQDDWGYYPAGKYNVKVGVDNHFDVYPIEIVSLDDMPEIGFDSEDPMLIKSEKLDDSGNWLSYKTQYVRVDVSGGETLKIHFDKASDDDSYFNGITAQPYYWHFIPADEDSGWDDDRYWWGYDEHFYGSSLFISAGEKRTYYLKMYPSCDVNVYAEKVKAVDSIEIVKVPEEDRFYEYFCSEEIKPFNVSVRVTYSDGSSEIVDRIEEFEEYGISYDIRDVSGNIAEKDISCWGHASGTVWGFSAGTYKIVLSAGKGKCEYERTIRPLDDIPVVQVDSAFNVAAARYSYNDAMGRGEACATPVFAMNLDEGDYFILGGFTEVLDGDGNRVSNSRWESFSISKAGRYYIVATPIDTVDYVVKKIGVVKGIVKDTDPECSEFVYGNDNCINGDGDYIPRGLKLKLLLADGSYSEPYEFWKGDFDSIFDFDGTYFADGTPAKLDADGHYAVGNYYTRFYYAVNHDVYIDIPLSVIPVPFDYSIKPGDELTLANNVRKDGYGGYNVRDDEGNLLEGYTIKLDLKKDSTYHFVFQNTTTLAPEETVWYLMPKLFEDKNLNSEIDLIDRSYKSKDCEKVGFCFKAKKDGTYYLKVLTSGCKLKVDKVPEITAVNVIAGVRNNITHSGPRYWAADASNDTFRDPAGVKLELVFESGKTIECEYGDAIWELYDIRIYEPYDSTGSKIKGTWIDGIGYELFDFNDGDEFFWQIFVPGYSNEIAGNEKLKVSIVSKDDLTIEIGQKRFLPCDEVGHITGSECYYIDVEQGKKYRVYTNVNGIIAVCDSEGVIGYNWDIFEFTAQNTEKVPLRLLGNMFIDSDELGVGSRYIYVEEVNGNSTYRYKVTFNSNYPGAGKAKTITQTITSGKFVALKANTFSFKGYSFKGWALSRDGKVQFSDKENVLNLAGKDETVNLYAQWEKETYRIDYVGLSDEKVSLFGLPVSYQVDSDSVLLSEYESKVVYPGCEFKGFYTSGKYSKKFKSIPTGSTGNKKVYVKLAGTKYRISFDKNEESIPDYSRVSLLKTYKASGTMKDQTMACGKSDNISKNAFAITGYEFVGWNTEKDGSGEAFADKAAVLDLTTEPGKVITFYAQWRRKDFAITYDGLTDEEVSVYELPKTYWLDSGTVSLEEFVSTFKREGYDFEGIYSDKKFKKKTAGIGEGNVGDRTIYVKLTPHKYKLSFDKNTDSIKDFKGEKLKSSGNMKKQTVTFGKNTAITKNGYKVTGYTFTGWNTKPDGSGKSYSDKEEVLNLTSESGEIIQLYAVWKKAEYTISYIGLDEEEVEKFALPTNYRIDDETITFEPYKAAIERTGYTFKNFYSDKKYKNVLKSIKSGSTGNKSVYVKMVANKYKLLFKRNEESLEGKPKCSGKMSAQTVTYDKKTKISANAFKINGYTFTGWNTEADGTGKSYENKEEILNLTSGNGETITLYAQWQKK